MKQFLFSTCLIFSVALAAQSKVELDVLSPKPTLLINGNICHIDNTIWSCVTKTCDSLVIMQHDSVEFCTSTEINLNTDSTYWLKWMFSGCSNFPVPEYDSFPTNTPFCDYPRRSEEHTSELQSP